MKADHPLVKEAGFHYLKDLIASGCLVYRFYKGFYHAKAILIDQRRCMISTANFDKRSLFLNEEVDVAIDDADFTAHVEEKIREHMEVSELMTEEKMTQASTCHVRWNGLAPCSRTFYKGDDLCVIDLVMYPMPSPCGKLLLPSR